MKDQVVMSRNSHVLAVAIPLYRMEHEEALANLDGYTVSLTKDEPEGFLVDCGEHGIVFIGAPAIYESLEFLGDL